MEIWQFIKVKLFWDDLCMGAPRDFCRYRLIQFFVSGVWEIGNLFPFWKMLRAGGLHYKGSFLELLGKRGGKIQNPTRVFYSLKMFGKIGRGFLKRIFFKKTWRKGSPTIKGRWLFLKKKIICLLMDFNLNSLASKKKLRENLFYGGTIGGLGFREKKNFKLGSFLSKQTIYNYWILYFEGGFFLIRALNKGIKWKQMGDPGSDLLSKNL